MLELPTIYAPTIDFCKKSIFEYHIDMREYNHLKIEGKWQKEWEKKGIYHASNNSKKKKYYSLIEFPYPSGAGMHVGHIRSNTAMDIISRKRRMEGFNVLYPIGWDAFGLPTENYAIKTGIQPAVVTRKNTDTFRKQLKALGFSFDWSREINTTDPKYYKWTQWIFLQFLKNKLAYKDKMVINWCPKDKIGLANEEVVAGRCERCGTQVEKREKEQWMLAITKYADRLYKDLDDVDFLPHIKIAQRNWIGMSEGAEIDFMITVTGEFFSGPRSSRVPPRARPFKKLSGDGNQVDTSVKVFTTRADTLFGATYLVLAPEHELVQKLKSKIENFDEVEKYIKEVKNKAEIERTAENKEKSGVELKGVRAINPATKKEIPVWIADYVLASYGTGAIMAVPAHDERDFQFAEKYKLPIQQVVAPVFDGIRDDDRPKSGMSFTDRPAIVAIVKHWEEDKILMLDWKKVAWHTLITGGIEEGQGAEDAARREILEETGYRNLKLVKKLMPFHSRFFHTPKNRNQFAHFETFYFELLDGEQDEISEEEKEKHQLKWVPKEKVLEQLTAKGQQMLFQSLLKPSAIPEPGLLVNSGKFDGLDSEKAKKEIVKFVGGKETVSFKLRDWVFSRQRYWGEPIPVIFCDKCGTVPVPEKDLPVLLPKVKNYLPTDTGESPLANISKWVNVKCPKCKGKAKRETDTMPNWAGSSWYYLRYTDAKNKKAFADKRNLKYWLGSDPRHGGVNWYNGGNEHTTLHLLYSRFWHKFLFDLKLVPTREPYMKRTSHGMILGEGGVKMSKSLGNVINPDEIVKVYGADTLRVYEMFMGPFNQSIAWSMDSLIGPRRFLEKVWGIGLQIEKNSRSASGFLGRNFADGRFQPEDGGMSKNFSLESLLHKTIKKVSEDIEEMKFNTAVSTLMIFVNEVSKSDFISREIYETFLKLLSPFAPHITEELWRNLGYKKSIHLESWPKYDREKIKDEEIKIAVQLNGKVRAEIMIGEGESEDEVRKKALAHAAISKYTEGKEPKRVIYIKNRLVNIVI